jgi:hypothetical protein
VRVLIDGKPHDPLTPEQEKDVRQFREEASVQGQVLSADEATAARSSQTRVVFVVLWFIVAVVSAVVALLADPADQPIVVPAAIVVVIALGAFFVFMHGRRARIWRQDLPRRLEGMATEGTAIGVDATGVIVAGRTHPWSSLAIEQVEFGRYGNRRANMFTLDRLALAGPEGRVVLDPGLMRNGHLIIGNAWRRMRATSK